MAVPERTVQPKILLVDDEPDNLTALKVIFRQDYQVFAALTGNEALEILGREQDVALIISDQRMPTMTGTEFLSTAAQQFPDTIRILLTGYAEVEDLVDAINTGKVFKYVIKPWHLDELKALVQQGIETHHFLTLRTQELNRALRQQSLLNTVTSTILNAQLPQSQNSPVDNVLQTIVQGVGRSLEVDICVLRLFSYGQEPDVGDHYFYFQTIVSTNVEAPAPIECLEPTVWETDQLVAIHDIHQESSWHQQQSLYWQVCQQIDIHSTLLVPIHWRQEVLAVLGLHRRGQAQVWTQDQIQLVSLVADQAALAISQARAYEKVQTSAQREALINSITTAIRASLDLPTIFSQIAQQLVLALDVDSCALSLWTKNDQYVQCVGLFNRLESSRQRRKEKESEAEALPRSFVPISQNPVLQKVIASKKAVAFNDLQAQPEMTQFDLRYSLGSRALLLVPLIVDDQIIGSISLRQTQTVHTWTYSEIELAEAVAAQAAIAVQQAQLYDQLKQLNSYLTESVLKRFLPEAIVNKAAAGELVLDLRPEPRPIVILFSDIVDFTPLSARLGPRQIAVLLNEYLEQMTRAVFEGGGTIDKFIGDAVLALFGAPEELPIPEQVARAIAVAKSMHHYLGELNERWFQSGILGKHGLGPVQFRCGIHQGNAVVGMFGGGQRTDYTAIGPAVNIAARLQAAAKPNTILISSAVADHVDPENLGKGKALPLKGIDVAIAAYPLKM